MSDIINESPAQAPRYRAAFAGLLDQIRALPEAEFAPINLDINAAVLTAEGSMPLIVAQRPLIVNQLPKFDINVFDQLENYALALGRAQTVYQMTLQPQPELQALAEQGTKIHEILVAEVTTLTKRGLIPSAALNNLLGANGYKNLYLDLFALSEVFTSNWDKVSARTTITQSELDDVENLADKLSNAVALRDHSPEVQASAARDRQAAFTLFVQAYDKVRAAISYVRHEQGDADSIMPSLYAGRSNGKKKPTVNPNPNPPEPTPVAAQTADPHVAPVVTPASATESAQAAPSPTIATPDRGPFMQ